MTRPRLAEMLPDGLSEAFWDYESALMADDLAALDLLFAPGPRTLRGDATGLVAGHAEISRFRGGRGGAPARTVVETHVHVVDDDHATVVAVTELARGGRGLQTQTWERQAEGWVVTAAHVSVPPPAVDGRVWRVVGTPLVAATGSGALDGETVAVKDLYAVAGQRVGAGNPARLAGAPTEPAHARAVEQLLAAGGEVTGIARTDELAYSLAGTNAHHGTPPNPRAPHRISGGSSSGSASAVSLGQASIGLGTDTGGSVRVPAAYQGLWGLRPTHGAVPTDGLLPLAPTFDTVGWLTRDAGLLRRVGDVLLPPATSVSGEVEVVVVPALLELAEPDVRRAVTAFGARLGAARLDWDAAPVAGWQRAFQTLQAWEAWHSHGAWLADHLDDLGDDVRARFVRGSEVGPDERDEAAGQVATARAAVRELVGERVLLLPSASSVAPALGPGLAERLQQVRDATMRLTCLAGLGGLPALGVPLRTEGGLPAGGCLVVAAGRDHDLLDLAARQTP